MVQTIEQKTYQTLRRRLLAGTWRPGEQLSAVAIAQQIGVSPTPVTQAIRQLERDGFVEVVPHFGAFVRQPKLRELVDLFDLRRALEVFAVRRVAKRGTTVQHMQLEELIDTWAKTIDARISGRQPDEKLIARAVESDLMFHIVIMQADGNRRAMKVFHDCHLLSRLFGVQTFAVDAEALASEQEDIADHRIILESLRQHESSRAGKAMDRHLRRGKKSLIESVKRSRSSSNEDREPAPWTQGIWAALRKVETYCAST